MKLKYSDTYSVRRAGIKLKEESSNHLERYTSEFDDNVGHMNSNQDENSENLNNQSYQCATPFSKTIRVNLDKTEFGDLPSSESKYITRTKSKKADKKFTTSEFVVLAMLGSGTFGCVVLVKHITTEDVYAVKVIKKSSISISNKQIQHIKHEKEVLAQVKNLECKLYVTLHETIQDNYWLYFFLDFIQGGELHTFIKK